ncbi:hypothetical protein Tco_1537162, partial [Tanacetum coccineum]
MTQSQRPADVHQNELCPPNKRYALMDANKKVDLENSLLPWIYLGQFWHTLTIFHLPQATDNNHDHFIFAPKFSKMVPFYINNLDFTLKLRSTSNFKTTGLLQPRSCKFYNVLSTISMLIMKNFFGKEINANMVFMAKMEKVLLDSEESLSSAEETII